MFGGKRAFGIFDQKCTLLKTFQISYEVLFRCVQQSPVFFFLLKSASFPRCYVCKKSHIFPGSVFTKFICWTANRETVYFV